MFIHEHDNWTSFRWDTEKISDLSSKVSHSIGFLYGQLSTIGFDNQLFATVESVTHDVVASSEIEDVGLNTEAVRSSVARRLGVTIKNTVESSHYIDSIVEMMLDATQNHTKPLSDKRLFGWHIALFPYGKGSENDIAVGKYRSSGMQVVSGMFGKEKIHYHAPEANRIETEMNSFLDWFNNPENEPSLIKSAIAHLWFVCIHPFDDGNGRIARAISDMVLARTDKSRFRYYSMSMQINKEKTEYYRILENISRGDGNITEWLDWYLQCLNRAVENSDSMISGILNKTIFWKTFSQTTLSERQRNTLNIYLDGYEGKLTAKNWARLSKVSLDTASRDVKDLLAKGVVTAEKGKVRDVSYSINYIVEDDFSLNFSDVNIGEINGKTYITAIYKDLQQVKEQLSDIDLFRFEQKETSLERLLYKYFAYLSEL